MGLGFDSGYDTIRVETAQEMHRPKEDAGTWKHGQGHESDCVYHT